MRLRLKRETKESVTYVGLEIGERSPDLKKNIETPLQFLNHMVETLAWRSCVNIEMGVETTDYRLTHVVCEDAGITMGRGFARLVEELTEAGVNGSADSTACIDEALARACISFEGRAFLIFNDSAVNMPECVEDMLCQDLLAFLEGFVQGAGATLHVDLLRGRDPHHIWESVFRALGEALRVCLSECRWRGGEEAGVKGKVEITEELTLGSDK